jgi:hypothetical protein
VQREQLELDPPVELELLTLHESGGYLFSRYAVLH